MARSHVFEVAGGRVQSKHRPYFVPVSRKAEVLSHAVQSMFMQPAQNHGRKGIAEGSRRTKPVQTFVDTVIGLLGADQEQTQLMLRVDMIALRREAKIGLRHGKIVCIIRVQHQEQTQAVRRLGIARQSGARKLLDLEDALRAATGGAGRIRSQTMRRREENGQGQ